jgi:GNAT superfamily N-acetyltransferase
MFQPDSPYQRNGELIPLLAVRDGRPVGRIAAIVNRAHNEYYRDRTGFFGFFDCIDDMGVALALFRAACGELRTRGLDTIRGPYNPTVNDECGLLVEGFDRPPFVMMPYNPPYYLPLYEGLGLKKARDLYAYYLSTDIVLPERIRKICERVRRSTGLTLRTVNLKRLDDELTVIHRLYNSTLDRNWGFVPITMDDLRFAAADLRAILNPELVMIAEKDGVPVGFSLCFPNVNETMGKLRAVPRILRAPLFLWHWKTSHPKEVRLAVLGVDPEFRGKGVAALFYAETQRRGRKTYQGGELSWVEESNDEIMHGIEVMGGKRYKTYRIYEGAIG